MGITPAAASQNIARLEQEIGTRLLIRSTRSLALTDAGMLYLERVAPVLDQLEQAKAEVMHRQAEPQGRLLLACTAAFGRHLVAPLLAGFIDRYPQVQLEVLMVDRHVDLVRENVDVVIRYRGPMEPSMVTRRLAMAPRMFCASREYLDHHGRPRLVRDLLAHRCLLYRRESDGRFMNWPFLRHGQRTTPPLRVAAIANDIETLHCMAQRGAGIAWVGRFIAQPLVQAGLLEEVCLLPDDEWSFLDEPLEFIACFRDGQQMAAKVRALVDYLAAALAGHEALGR